MAKKYPFDVVYEDNHLIAVSKESGVLIQGDSTGDAPLSELVKQYLKEKYNKPGNVFTGVIHRLDRPVSGLVILAKTSKGLERMNTLFREKTIYKTYWAIVKRRPKEMSGRLVDYLLKNPEKNTTRVVSKSTPGALRAELTYTVKGKLNDHYLVEVHPVTGRPHQIRVQLANMGCPIRGDVKYGFSKLNPNPKSINLHAKKVRFIHPIKKEEVLISAGVPNEPFWEQFLTLDEVDSKDIDLFIK